jgi:hypothetical protein
MDELAAIFAWSARATATWYAAEIIGGVLILLADLTRRQEEPTDGHVRRTAQWYRRMYGANALMVLGDHILGASFAPDRRHVAFLRRMARYLLGEVVTPQDRARAIVHQGPAHSHRA